MSNIINKLYNSYSKLKLFICAAFVLCYIVFLQLGGGHFSELLLLGLCIAAYIILPGLLFSRIVHRLFAKSNMPQWQQPLLALLYGSGFFAALYCFAVRLGFPLLLRLIPPVISVMYIALSISALRRKLFKNKRPVPKLQSHQWLFVLLYCSLLLLYTFSSVIKYAHPEFAGETILNQDLLWNTGNAESFKLAFPAQDIRFLGVRLQYHYFTELLCGALSIISGISCYNILAFYLQPFILAALIISLYNFALIAFKNNRFKSILFVYFPFIFTDISLTFSLFYGTSVFWNSYTSHLATNINGYATATIFLCIFCALYFHAAQNAFKVGIINYINMLAAFFILCFCKGPVALLLAVALLLSLIAGFFTHTTKPRALVLSLMLLIIYYAVFNIVFRSGASGSLQISAQQTMLYGRLFGPLLEALKLNNAMLFKICLPALMLLQCILMLPAQMPLFLRGLFADLRRFNQISPQRMLAYAMAPGGLIGYLFFFHPNGMSQIYLLFACVFFISYLAVDNIGYVKTYYKRLFCQKPQAAGSVNIQNTSEQNPHKKNFGKKTVYVVSCALAAVAFITTAMLYTYMLGGGLRQHLRNTGVLQKYSYNYVYSKQDEAAAEWLRQNTSEDTIFATNRVQHNPINSFYTAFSGRQCFLEEYSYTKGNMGLSDEFLNARLAENAKIFSERTSIEDIIDICAEYNIRYLLYARQRGALTGTDEHLKTFDTVFENESVTIYKVA